MEDLIKGLNVANIFCLMHVGDMPADKCMYSTTPLRREGHAEAARPSARMRGRRTVLVQADLETRVTSGSLPGEYQPARHPGPAETDAA